jgi:hypothetical protein
MWTDLVPPYLLAMTAIASTHPADTTGRLSSYGLVGAVASALGAALAVVLIAWDPQVAADRFSYPFDAAWFTTAQVVFAVQHVAMLPLFAGLLLLERSHPSRALRVGAWIGLVGQVLLTLVELVAITAADDALETGWGAVVGSMYGAPMVLMGVGLVVAGVGAHRVGLFGGAARWLVLALGVYVFVVLFPAVFGPMVAGRIAIGVWMLGFAALGLAMRRTGRSSQSSPDSPASSVSPSITTTA